MTKRTIRRMGRKSTANHSCVFCHQVSLPSLGRFFRYGRRKPSGDQRLMEPKEMIRPSGIAPMSVTKNSLSVCKKPTFRA